MQSKVKKICGYNVWVACKLLLAVFAVVLGMQMCAMSVQAEGEGYSGTPVKPSKITAENYEDYGFTADNYEEYLGYYGIRNAEELYGFAEMVNMKVGNTDYLAHNTVVVEDIIVNLEVFDEEGYLVADELYSWAPMCYFHGIFDGMGHTISGLYYEDSSRSNVGLFGKLEWWVGTTKIRNVNIQDSYIEGNEYVGGIVGSVEVDNTKIENCSFSGQIVGKNHIGGILGRTRRSNTFIQNCFNAGSVEGLENVGGIVGADGSVEKCYNTGDVTGVTFVGGIIGADGTVVDCYNTGKIEGEGAVAGISPYATISNCYNTGYCKSNSASAIGKENTNSYYLDTCGGEDKDADVKAKTAEQFANGEVCFLLNGSTSKGRLSWYQTLGTDATPVFEGDIIYASYAHGATEGTYSNTKKEGVHTTPDEDGSHDTYYEMVTNEYGVSLYICSVCGHVKNPFADVFEKDWYYPYVCFAYQNMLMSGKGTDENGLIIFDPINNMTRAEFVQALYSKEGKPEIVYQERFDDVPAGKWFTNAIMWAAENEIVSGKGDIFDVSGKITREEMAAILYKYAAFKGYETTGRKEATAYKDADSISKWAVNSIEWALYYGIMNGKGELLDPKGNATRAECATMLKSFIITYE